MSCSIFILREYGTLIEMQQTKSSSMIAAVFNSIARIGAMVAITIEAHYAQGKCALNGLGKNAETRHKMLEHDSSNGVPERLRQRPRHRHDRNDRDFRSTQRTKDEPPRILM
jgi:hypothetical protein